MIFSRLKQNTANVRLPRVDVLISSMHYGA